MNAVPGRVLIKLRHRPVPTLRQKVNESEGESKKGEIKGGMF
jgi:hypothetical protein